jgi:hypothetical protein
MEPPFFFLHVMKTGGTAFVINLLRNFGPGEVYPGPVDKRERTDVRPYASVADLLAISPERRSSIRIYTGHFPYAAIEMMGIEVRTLTLLRDPVDRTVSVLKHFKSHFERYAPLSLAALYDDPFLFEQYVHDHQTRVFATTPADAPETVVSTLTHEQNRARHLGGPDPEGAVPGGWTTITVDAARLELAKTNLARIDVVGVNARYTEFVETLRTRFGWWPQGVDTAERVNVGDPDLEVDAALRRRIADDKAFDVQLYEFADRLAP